MYKTCGQLDKDSFNINKIPIGLDINNRSNELEEVSEQYFNTDEIDHTTDSTNHDNNHMSRMDNEVRGDQKYGNVCISSTPMHLISQSRYTSQDSSHPQSVNSLLLDNEMAKRLWNKQKRKKRKKMSFSTQSESSASGISPEAIYFKNLCQKQNRKLRLNIDETEQIHGDSLSPTDKIIIDVYRLTEFKYPDRFGTLDTFINCFWDASLRVTSCFHDSTHSISDIDIITFLEQYSILDSNHNNESNQNDDLHDEFADLFSTTRTHHRNQSHQHQLPNNNERHDNNETLQHHLDSENEVQHINSTMRQWQDNINTSRENIILSNADIARIKLYKMLSKADAPKYLFEQIQRWAIKYCDVFVKAKKATKRKTFIKSIGERIYSEDVYKSLCPKKCNLVLPRLGQIPIVTFSLMGSIVSLLTNKSLMKEENLLLDSKNPLKKPSLSNTFNDVNSGWWYQKTVNTYCTNNNDLLLPIILFIDGSNIDKSGRLSAEPVSMTLGIFNRDTRNKPEAWRTLGFIESLEHKVVDDEIKINKQLGKINDYHAILGMILKEMKNLQGKSGGFHWNLSMRNTSYDVVFKVVLQFIIGDCKGNDYLCGRFGSHNKATNGFCRDCKVKFEESDNPNHQCTFINNYDVSNQTSESLRHLGFHKVCNAFDSISFGESNRGIYGATPSEPLHAFKLGLCKYLYEGFKEHSPPTTRTLIDKMLKRLINNTRYGSIVNLPSISVLQNGLDGCGTMTAEDQLARVIGIFITLSDPSILKSLAEDDRYEKKTDSAAPTRCDAMGFNKACDWFQLFERSIIYHSWLYSESHDIKDILSTNEYKTYIEQTRTNVVRGEDETIYNNESQSDNGSNSDSDSEEESKAMLAVREYLSCYKETLCRTKGNGMKIVKFHQQLHNTRQIYKDGSLLNIDGGRCEGNSIQNLKKPGKLTQKRSRSLSQQVADNIMSDQVISDACMVLDDIMDTEHRNENYDKEEGQIISDGISRGSKYYIRLVNPDQIINNPDQIDVSLEWKGKKYRFDQIEICQGLARRLFLNIKKFGRCLHRNSVVEGFTEYYKDGYAFRCHPQYRNGEEWMDWATLRWETNDGYEYVPAKICMFLNLENTHIMSKVEHQEFCSNFEENPYDEIIVDDGNNNDDDEEYNLTRSKFVLVQSCFMHDEYKDPNPSQYHVESDIAERFFLEDCVRLMPIECINGPANCIHVGNRENEIVCLQQQENWKDYFYTEND